METRKGRTSSDLKGGTKKSETKKCFTKQGTSSVGVNQKMRKNSNGGESKKGKHFPEKENKNCSKGEKLEKAAVEKAAVEKTANDVDNNLSYKKLRKKLNNLNYKGSLCLSCTPLVQIIFDDLIQAIQNFQKLSDKYEDSQKRYKELVNEKRKNNSQLEAKEGGDGKIGSNLFLSGEYGEGDDTPDQVGAGVVPNESNQTAQNEHSLSAASKQYERKISELCKQVEEECKLKEIYMKANKKLMFTLEMLQNEKKGKFDESTEDVSCDDFSSFNNRTKSFDDFEIDKIKKKEKKLCQMGSSLINEHTISLGKELSYYKNLCKEFKVEIDRMRKDNDDEGKNGEHNTDGQPQDGDHPTEGENKSGSTGQNGKEPLVRTELLVEQKNTEIKYLRKRLSEYEIEIRKLNELRMINDIKEQKESNDDESACESASSELLNRQHTMCTFDPDGDTLSGDVQTKNGGSVRKDNNLSKMIKSRNREIYHLKNRVKLLETELQMKNEEEKKYEKLHQVGDNRGGELQKDRASNVRDENRSGNSSEEDEAVMKRRDLQRELHELHSVLETLKVELKEEKKKVISMRRNIVRKKAKLPF